MVKNINKVVEEKATFGQRMADGVALFAGSWRFIIIQSMLLICWIFLNVLGWMNHWDPYPFILLNLCLSFQAAYATPIILMSQNRQAAIDRMKADIDFETNVKAEMEIQKIREHLNRIEDKKLKEIADRLSVMEKILGQSLPPKA